MPFKWLAMFLKKEETKIKIASLSVYTLLDDIKRACIKGVHMFIDIG